MKINLAEARSQTSVAGLQPARRGMALVITLILLSVTLIMAVAFLAMSKRERGAVTTATDTTIARLAADSALAAAQAQIIANVLATNTGLYDFHLLSSTTFTNYNGAGYNQFNIGNILPRPIVMMTNLTLHSNESRFYLDLNRNGQDDPGTDVMAGDPEWIGVLERPDAVPGPNNKFVARYAFFAQPVGNALDLNYIHNEAVNQTVDGFSGQLGVQDSYLRNQGVGSWELNLAGFLNDLNPNQWNQYNYNPPPAVGGNSGAAFDDARSLLSWRYGYNYKLLATANSYFTTNIANYPANIDVYSDGTYGDKSPQTTVDVNPTAVADTTSLPWAGADSTNRFFALPSELFDPSKSSASFVSRLTNAAKSDAYTFYKLLDQMGTDSPADDPRMNLNYSNAVVSYNAAGVVTNIVIVPGAETNLVPWTATNFFHAAANRLLTNYTARWLAADSNNYAATFGTNVPLCLTNIPVLVSNQFVYSPAVHRLLQLAANIYDATTTNFYPSVFRPVFNVVQNANYTNMFITGYNYVSTVNGISDPIFSQPTNALGAAAVAGPVSPTVNIYGVPWIIGAKKGLPAFNQFSMRNDATISRKLQLSKAHLSDNPSTFTTSQMYTFIFDNSIGYWFWNSVSNSYPNPVTIVARDYFSETITNDVTPVTSYNVLLQTSKDISITNTILANNWPGTGWPANSNSFQTLNTNSFFVVSTNFYLGPTNTSATNGQPAPPFAIYRFNYYNAGYANQSFEWNGTNWQTPNNTPSYPQNGLTPPLPRFFLLATNQLQMFILDNNHVIDYVHFVMPMTNFDLTSTNILLPNDAGSSGAAQGGLGGLTDADSTFKAPNPNLQANVIWSTNANTANYKRYGSPAQTMSSGVFNQVMISLGVATPEGCGQNYWIAPPENKIVTEYEKAEFLGFFTYNPPGEYQYQGKIYFNTNQSVQAPYTPTRTVYNYTHWQANDPLVHYLVSDLYFTNNNTSLRFTNDTFVGVSEPDTNTFISRFSPWGLDTALTNFNNVDTNGYNLAYKDPGVVNPDNWDFPTNKFPTPGWLGRVHRGTPWQTVYLKASDILTNKDSHNVNIGTNTWVQWTGDTQSASNVYYDAINSLPVSDYYLFDLFTTKINDNGRHGALPVNVGSGGSDPARGLAAWSALFSGMVVMTNTASGITPIVISPAGTGGITNSAVGWTVTNINFVRTNMVNLDGVKGVFEHIGDVLRSPLLTEQSPFLNWKDLNQRQNNISDEVYEWLPQQSMGLLRLNPSPRYVIYCYGQALRPAPNSVNLTASNFGLVTNYQVVAESAARAVLSVKQHLITNATGVVTGTNYSTTIESYNVLGPD